MAITLTLGTSASVKAANSKLGRLMHPRIIKRRYPALTATSSTVTNAAISRQQDIENALCMALFHIRQNGSIESIRAATGRAMRATSMLKQACTELSMAGGSAA